MYKAVFLDIDWTLLSHTAKCIPQSAVSAIKKFQEHDIKFIMATGRNFYEMQFLPINDVKFDGYIAINGQIIMDKNKNVLYEEKMRNTNYLIKEFNKKEIPIMFVEKDLAYVNIVNEWVKKTMNIINTPVPKQLAYTGRDFYQAIVFADEEYMKRNINKFKGFDYLHWQPMAADIVIKGVDKVTGVKKFCKINNFKKEEIIAIGDGKNDVKMIEYAGLGIAMGNACNEAKNVANYVTDDIDNDGLANALNKFLLSH